MDDFEELVEKLKEEDRVDEVIDLCTREIIDNPKNAQAYYEKAYAEHYIEQQTLALIDVNKSIEISPNELNLTLKGFILWKLDDKKGAIRLFTQALEYDKEFLLALGGRCDCYYFEQDYEKALQEANYILSIYPNQAKALSVISNVECKYGNYDIALETIKKAVESEPEDPYFHWELGNVYSLKNEFDNAILEFNKAIELDNQFPDAYWSIGKIYAYRQQFQEAIEYYNKAIELYPHGVQSEYHANRAVAYQTIGNIEQAMNDINKAIELNCNNYYCYLWRAAIKKDLQDFEGAIKDCEYKIKHEPNDIYGYTGIADILCTMKKYNKALKYINKGLKIAPKEEILLDFKNKIQQNTFVGKIKSFFNKNN